MNEEAIIALVILAIAVGIFTLCFMFPIVILKIIFGLCMVVLVGFLFVKFTN